VHANNARQHHSTCEQQAWQNTARTLNIYECDIPGNLPKGLILAAPYWAGVRPFRVTSRAGSRNARPCGDHATCLNVGFPGILFVVLPLLARPQQSKEDSPFAWNKGKPITLILGGKPARTDKNEKIAFISPPRSHLLLLTIVAGNTTLHKRVLPRGTSSSPILPLPPHHHHQATAEKNPKASKDTLGRHAKLYTS
jgi:hypothetical protein